MKSALGLPAIAIFACAVAYGQQAAMLSPTPGTFAEAVDASRPVSGSVIAGVALRSEARAIKLQDLWAYIPAGFKGDISAVVITSDGRYAGSVEFPVDRGSARWVQLGYPASPLQKVLNDYAGQPIAIRVSDAGTGRLFLSRLGKGHSSEIVEFTINSERSQSFVLLPEGQGIVRKPCRTLPPASSLNFDTVCDVPRKVMDSGTPVRLLRRQGAQILPVVELDVRLD